MGALTGTQKGFVESAASPKKGDPARNGIIAVVLQTIAAIVSFFVAKDTLFYFDAEPLVLLRSCAAAVLLAIMIKTMPGPAPEWRKGDLWRLAGLGFLAVPMNQGLYFHGLAMTTAAHSALLYALTPALVLIAGRILGTERFAPARVAGIALAFAGVVVVLASRPPSHDATSPLALHQVAGAHVLRGNLWVLGAVLAWALYTAFARDVVARLGTVRATGGALGLGALMFLPFGLWRATHFDFSSVPPHAWLGVAYLAVVASTLSYLLWYYAIRRLAPSRVAVFNNLQPVGAALLAWALGARPGPALFAGAALVIGGVVLAQSAGRRAPR